MAILIHTTRTPREKATIPMFNGAYMGEELRPFEGRRSAMQAHALPSRRGDALRWPDGRITDLHGNAYTEKAAAATLPVFPGKVRGGNKPLEAKQGADGLALEEWGIKKSLSKLNPTKVREIRAMKEAGLGNMEIAKKYDIHASSVKNIVTCQTWKEVK